MKVVVGILGLMLFAAVVQAQTDIQLGQITIAGSACRDNHESPRLHRGLLQIPLEASVQKSNSQKLANGGCAFTLPIQIRSGSRLIVRDTLASGDVKLSKETKSRIQLEIFAAGERGEVLERVDGSQTQKVRRSIHLRQEGDVLVSECGANLLLRGNASILLQGSARASAELDDVQLTLETERCQ